jgi:hypothetical protein
MYALLVIFKYNPEAYEGILRILEQGPEALKGKKGFKSGIYFSDKEKHEFGAMTIWERKRTATPMRSHRYPRLR